MCSPRFSNSNFGDTELMKRVSALTFLNYFVSGALTLLIPLLLLARNVDLAGIALILSALPIVFLFARLFFAAVADRIGWSHIFILVNWPATVFSSFLYFVAISLPVFLGGKIVEALRESSYWAVNRTAVFTLSPNREAQEATRINGVIWLATAIGSAAAGMGMFYVGFSVTLALLIVASALIGVPAALLWKTAKKRPKPEKQSLSAILDPRGKGKKFWLVSVALMFYGFAVYPIITLLLPVFMEKNLGYNYMEIGLLFMLYNAIAAAVTWATVKTSLDLKHALAQSVICLAATIPLAISGLFFPALLCALAFVRGYSVAFFEHLVASVAKTSKNVSVDIGWLHVPMRLSEFSSVLAAGFAVQALGYGPVFVATGICFITFSTMAFNLLKKQSN